MEIIAAITATLLMLLLPRQAAAAETKNLNGEEFPEYAETPDGAARIETTGDEIGVRLIREIEYAAPDGIPLHLNILVPETRSERGEKYPCIVYVQGSAWMEQDIYAAICSIDALVKRGCVAAIVQYRHSGQAAFPAQVIDTCSAVRFMRAHADEYSVDSEKIFLGGSSSGGHVATLAALTDGGAMDENLFPNVSADVIGVLDYYGSVSLLMEDGYPSTVNHHMAQSPEGKLLGGKNVKEYPELAAAASAVTYIAPEKKIPPFCIFHGTKDRIVNVRQSVELYEKLRACGKKARLCLIGGAGHGGPEFWTQEACDAAWDFMQECLKTDGVGFSAKNSRKKA